MGTGWFGKLPWLGDFAQRGLPRHFVDPWDAWLQRVLPASRDRLGDAWLDAYLASPFWRFALPAGACGPGAWIGVLMPSVDRVGRPFPLTVARPLAADVGVWAPMRRDGAWFAAVEDRMLAALHPAQDPDDFTDVLRLLPRAEGADADAAAHEETPGRAPRDLPRDLPPAWSCWSTTGSGLLPACRLQCIGLPTERGYAALLDGDWRGAGWTEPTPDEDFAP